MRTSRGKVSFEWIGVLILSAALAGCAGATATEPSDASASALPTAPTEASTAIRGAPDPMPASSASVAPASTAAVPLRSPTPDELRAYTWLDASVQIRKLEEAFPTPAGFSRVSEADGTFGAWLRGLPLRAPSTPVKTFSGGVLRQSNDPRIAAVAEIDIGTTDLQQCADSVIRMNAEWLWSRDQQNAIGYHFLSGEYAPWRRYAEGQRPSADGAKIVWKTSAKPDQSRATFRKYLDVVFMYASTISLALHSDVVAREDLRPGDFFVMPGGPGHAVLVLDMATSADGRKIALLGQGYMPAQDFQVLHPEGETAWFSLDGNAVDTPFWPAFPWTSLHRFSEHSAATASR